jgi:hypothetical protein
MCIVHPDSVDTPTAARQVPGGLSEWFVRPRCRYQYPREKKPRSASTKITIRMIQRMLTCVRPSLRLSPAEVSVFVWEQRGTAAMGDAGQKIPWIGQ